MASFFYVRFNLIGSLLAAFLVSAPSFVGATDVIDPASVQIPSSLGVVESPSVGRSDQPLIFIVGESHVSMDVQRKVFNILGYLRMAYGAKLVLLEGFADPLKAPMTDLPLSVRRAVAKSEFEARRINAVERFLLSYLDVKVVGVEDMVAYSRHGKELDSLSGLNEKAEQWNQDFTQFLMKDLGQQKATTRDAERISVAFKQLAKDKDLDAFTKTVSTVFGAHSRVSRKLADLNQRMQQIESKSNVTNTDSPFMQARDRGMVTNSLKAMVSTKVATLVVGTLHLPGIRAELDKAGIAHASIIPVGLEEDLKGDFSATDREVYESWKRGEASGYETLRLQFKPLPALSRKSKSDSFAILNDLFYADFAFARGATQQTILAQLQQTTLPSQFRIRRIARTAKGTAIEFEDNDRVRIIYFGPDINAVGGQLSNARLTGEAGGRYYAIFDGGGGRKPPIDFGGGFSPPGDGGGFFRRSGKLGDAYERAVALLEKKTVEQAKQDVLIAFVEIDNRLVRSTNGEEMPLGLNLAEAKRLVADFHQASVGPELLEAARKLSEALLVDLDGQLPIDPGRLMISFEDDAIGNLNLPFIADLVKEGRVRDAKSVYYIPWDSAKKRIDQIILDEPQITSVNQTVVLITDDLRASPDYEVLVKRWREAGFQVNSLLEEAQEVLIVSGLQGKDWQVTLAGFEKPLNAYSEQMQRLLQRSDDLVSINADIQTEWLDQVSRVREEKTEATESLKVADERIQGIEKAQGEQPTASVDRKIGKRVAEEVRKVSIDAKAAKNAIFAFGLGNIIENAQSATRQI